MTHEELESYRERFNEVMKAPERIRNVRLITLMDDLQQTYNIPTLSNRAYEKANPEVIKLFREVSNARTF